MIRDRALVFVDERYSLVSFNDVLCSIITFNKEEQVLEAKELTWRNR